MSTRKGCAMPHIKSLIADLTKEMKHDTDKSRNDVIYRINESIRSIAEILDDKSSEIRIPDDLIQRLEPLKHDIDVVSIEKGGDRIDTHIYISLIKGYKQPWHITLDTWRKVTDARMHDYTKEEVRKTIDFLFDVPDLVEKEMQNLTKFFCLPRSEQKKWLDFRQTFGKTQERGITPEIQKIIDEF